MVLVIYHNTNSTTMNDLYLKFDPSSNMNLTNLRLMCNVMGRQIWTLALLLFPGCYMISSQCQCTCPVARGGADHFTHHP